MGSKRIHSRAQVQLFDNLPRPTEPLPYQRWKYRGNALLVRMWTDNYAPERQYQSEECKLLISTVKQFKTQTLVGKAKLTLLFETHKCQFWNTTKRGEQQWTVSIKRKCSVAGWNQLFEPKADCCWEVPKCCTITPTFTLPHTLLEASAIWTLRCCSIPCIIWLPLRCFTNLHLYVSSRNYRRIYML
jgi:hypothetical protein